MSAPNTPRSGNGNDPDHATMRQIAGELGAAAPTPASWESIAARADRDGATPRIDAQATGVRRGFVMGFAAASLVALVVGLVVLAQRGESGQLVPTAPGADTVARPDTAAPATTTPVTTAAPDTTSSVPGPVAVTTTAPSPPTTLSGESTITTIPGGDVVELTPTPVSQISRLPADAWVVATALPERYQPAYAVDEGLYRRVVYRDGDGNSIQIHTLPQPFVAGEPIDIEGMTWLLQQSDDGTLTLQREFTGSMIDVSFVGLDVDEARPVVSSLVAGSASVLPIDPLRPSPDYRDHDLLAADPDNPTTTVRGFGIDGWYCLEVAGPRSSTLGCGHGRDGAMSSEVHVSGNSIADEDGSITLTASSIVSSNVARVEVRFTDGTTTTAVPSDLSGKYDERFWIATTRLGQDDPFQDPAADFEIRLFDTDGTLLGLAPLPAHLG